MYTYLIPCHNTACLFFPYVALMKVLFWLLHPDPGSRATLKDLAKDKWTNQDIDLSLYSFDSILGAHVCASLCVYVYVC